MVTIFILFSEMPRFGVIPEAIRQPEGDDLLLNFTIFGIPKPSVKCMRDDEELLSSNEILIVVDGQNLSVKIPKASRTMSGKYMIFLQNEVGKAEAMVEVLIYGRYCK